MIYTPPPQVPTTTQTNERQVIKADLNDLSDTKVGQYFRELKLRNYLQRIINKNESLGVKTGVAVMNTQTKRNIIAHDIDEEHFAASVNKVPVAQLVLNDLRAGTLQFDQKLTWTAADKRAGAGFFDQADAPLEGTVRDLLFDILNPSGNTAVRALVNGALGGATQVNERFKNELKLQHTYLQPLDGNRFYLGNSTARESMKSIERLVKGRDQYKTFVKDALSTNIYEAYGVRSQLAGNDYIVLANKVGILDDIEGNNRHDVGIMYNTRTGESLSFAMLTTAMGEPYDAATSQAGISLADMGAGMLRHIGDTPQHAATENFRTFNGPESVLPDNGRLLY